jgi:uncharacterized protein (TIGR03382 family)
LNARRPLVFAAAVLALAASPARAAQVWTASATEKLRPATPARSQGAASLAAARNEFEAFQIAVTGAAAGVRATATDLSGPGGAIPVRLYREELIVAATASTLDGGTGPWPDALVPAVDEVVGEARNAFPFTVSAGETRAIWAEVHVPAGAAAGTYTGTVSIAWDGGGATVPVTLTVWPFGIPSTASLKSAFALNYGALPTAHGVPWWGDAFSALRARYGQLALDHRVSLSHVDDGDPALAHLTQFYGGELDGAAPTTLAGAKLTNLEFVGRGAYQEWASWFAARGWTDRLFQYTCDEPEATCRWSDIPARAATAHATTPPMRTLVTTTIQEATAAGVAGSIDILVPVINYMDDKPGNRFAGNQRPAYDAFLAQPGHELWLYQSCMSHGCGGASTSAYHVGWPTYMIDASAVRNRAMEWLSFKYGATGELYYETALVFRDGNDPWTSQWSEFGGNGDGTLFYPGTPARIGGTKDVPVASIRLKMIREGMEDYEYMKLLEDAGEGAFARGIVDGLFPHPYSTEVTPDALLAARAALAERIVALGLGGGDAGGGGGDGAGSGGGSGGGGAGSGGGTGAGDTPGVVPVASGCASASGPGVLALAGLAALALSRRRRRG